ncbi:hypothetical protein [Methylomonas sp. AM2-LC]|uniref:hypothetical protein n=1 Tax=Methylomonas sp. AM2-LC TaxID=3153301 RepID=UPI003267B380
MGSLVYFFALVGHNFNCEIQFVDLQQGKNRFNRIATLLLGSAATGKPVEQQKNARNSIAVFFMADVHQKT